MAGKKNYSKKERRVNLRRQMDELKADYKAGRIDNEDFESGKQKLFGLADYYRARGEI